MEIVSTNLKASNRSRNVCSKTQIVGGCFEVTCTIGNDINLL